jgi:hypothetical protein
MPAERMSGAIPVRSDPRTQPPRLCNQLLARHGFEILVHNTSVPAAASGRCCVLSAQRLPATCLASAGLRSSVCFDVTQELIHETPRIRKRYEMATCKLVDGHVQSFLRDAPLEVDWKKSVVAGGDDVGRNLGPPVESTGLAEDDVGLGPLVRVSLLEDLGWNVV